MKNISCFIVYHNENDLVKSCVESVIFCDEIIVIDISNSSELPILLEGLPVNIVKNEKKAIVELLRKENIASSKHRWILLIDPDERIDPFLAKEMIEIHDNLPQEVAAIQVPWQFYFGKKALRGTFWGQPESKKMILFDKNRVEYSNKLHVNHRLIDSRSRVYSIKRNGDNVLHHYWATSFSKLYQKHKRYLAFEGEHKYKVGKRFDRIQQLKALLTNFYDSFVIFKGWKDGIIGFRLSLFFTWYHFEVMEAVRKYQKTIKEG